MNSNGPLCYPSVLLYLADYNRCLIIQLQCFKHITFLFNLFILKVSHLRLFESLKPKQKIIRTIIISMTLGNEAFKTTRKIQLMRSDIFIFRYK